MNIFILDQDLTKSAELLCDQHLNKQILELAQILSTAGYGPYKPTHRNHPVTKWAGLNLRFCFKYLHILHNEYQNRTGKTHKSYIDTKDYETRLSIDYIDSGDKFPIRNDFNLIQDKYKEWAARAKPMYPKFSKVNKYKGVLC